MSGVTAAASLGLAAVGTGMQIYGQVQGQAAAAGQAAQQRAMGVYQAQVQAAAQAAQARWEQAMATQKKEIAERAATDATARGEGNVIKARMETNQIAGGQRARLAAQGTDFSGSATTPYADTYGAGEYEAQVIRNNAVREAYGHKLEATDAENAFRLAKAKDDNARPGVVWVDYQPSNYAAAGSALAGASDLAAKWWKFQQAGAFGSDPFKGSSPAAVGQPAGARPVTSSDLTV